MGLLDEAIREHLELKRLRGADPADVARMERDALGPARRPDSGADALAEGEIDEAALYADAARGTSAGGAPAPDDAGYEEPLEDPLLEHDVDVPDPYAGEPPLEPTHWDEVEAEPAAGLSEGLRPPPTTSADETSIAPASYGQETAEFDVESAVLDSPDAEPAAPPPAPAEPAAPPPVPARPGAAPGPHAPDLSEHDPVAAPPPSPDEPGPYGDPAAGQEGAADFDRAGSIDHDAALDDDRTQVHSTGPAAERAAEEAHHPSPAPAPEPPAGAEESAEDVLEETPDFLQETPEHERLWFEQRPPRDFDFDK
jgi:hypothetical protein